MKNNDKHNDIGYQKEASQTKAGLIIPLHHILTRIRLVFIIIDASV